MNLPLQSLKAVRAIAEAVVRELSADCTIAAVLPSEAHGPYAEVLVVRPQSGGEPKRVVIGINRDSSPFAIRAAFAAKLVH